MSAAAPRPAAATVLARVADALAAAADDHVLHYVCAEMDGRVRETLTAERSAEEVRADAATLRALADAVAKVTPGDDVAAEEFAAWLERSCSPHGGQMLSPDERNERRTLAGLLHRAAPVLRLLAGGAP